MVVVDVPHEPSDGPVLLGWAGGELPVEGLCDRLRPGVGFSIEGDWDVVGGSTSEYT